MVRWSWWLAIVWFNIWKQQVRSLAYLRKWWGKVILSWGGKKQVNRASRCLSDETCHIMNVPPPTLPGETVQQLGGHPKCIPPSAGWGHILTLLCEISAATAKIMLPISRVVANHYDLADLTFLNAAWSAGWSTDHKMKGNGQKLVITGPRGSAVGLEGRSKQGAHRAQDPGHKSLLKSEDLEALGLLLQGPMG